MSPSQMPVDFTHPRNENILRYLRNPFNFIRGPKADAFRQAREEDLSNSRIMKSQSPDSVPWTGLGTHPDVLERFWKGITVRLPEPCQWVVYGAPVLVYPRTGLIFGWAGGSFDYALRLPAETLREALSAGAKSRSAYGSGDALDLQPGLGDWVLLNWLDREPEWCLQAYLHAENQ